MMIFIYAVIAIVYSLIAIRITVFYCIYGRGFNSLNPNITKIWLIAMFWPIYLIVEVIDSFRSYGVWES